MSGASSASRRRQSSRRPAGGQHVGAVVAEASGGILIEHLDLDLGDEPVRDGGGEADLDVQPFDRVHRGERQLAAAAVAQGVTIWLFLPRHSVVGSKVIVIW